MLPTRLRIMLIVLSTALLAALQPPTPPNFVPSRRAVLTAAPLAASSAAAANAFNPLDILFGWIPPVGDSPEVQKSKAPDQLTTAEKIRARRKQLAEEEAEKQMAEYMKNRGNSAASVRTDIAGAGSSQ